MLTELIKLHHKIKEEMKATQSEIKQYIQGAKIYRKGSQDSNQQFGVEGRNKHSAGKE